MHRPDRPSLVGGNETNRIHPTLLEADSALERGDLIRAGTHYIAVAREAPDNGEAWLGVSRVLSLAGEFDRAAELLDRAIAQECKSKAWLALAQTLLTSGDFDRAAELIDRSIALEPNDPAAYSLKALVFRSTGNGEAELSALKHALQHSPDDLRLWDAIVATLERTSGPEAAIDFLEGSRDIPEDLAVDLLRARLCVSAGRIGEAESRLRTILGSHPDEPEAHSVQAFLLLTTGKHKEAFSSLERAMQYSPSDPQLWETMISVLQHLRGPEATIDYLDRHHATVPKDVVIDLRRAQLCVSAGLMEEAESRMRAISSANPKNRALRTMFATFLVEQADAALQRGDLVQARTHYAAATREAPENKDAWCGLARIFVIMGEIDRARELVDHTINPANKAEIWLELSRVLVNMHQLDRATEFVTRAIALDPKSSEAHAVRALIARNKGDDEAELHALKRAVRFSPTDLELWEALITVLERVSGPEAAIDYLEDNRDSLPKGIVMDLRKARLCAAAGQLRKLDVILRRIRASLEANPDKVAEHVAVARHLAEMGQEQLGLDLLRELTTRHRTTPSPFIALADLLRGENTTIPEAIPNLRHAISLEAENPGLLRSLAECHARQARYDEAAGLFLTALNMSGEASVPDYIRLGTVLRHAGRIPEAESYLHKALERVSEEITAEAGNSKERAAKLSIAARILVALGRRGEACEQYRRMLHECAASELRYDPPIYLPDTPARLDRLRHIVRGRDTLILSHGPSISALADWQDRLSSLDVCLAAVNRFRVFETGVLSCAGRTVDVLLETHYKAVRQLIHQILEFLERPRKNLFIASRWEMERLGSSCPTRRDFEERFDDRLLYFGGAGGVQPATPYDPLRCVQGNSLSVLISLITIGGAKRIFLLGADGGVVEGRSGDTHYGCREEEFRFHIDARMREAVSASLRADALEFPDAVETGLLSVEGLFGIKPPPIFNVSPSSRLEAFPKITYAAAWSMLSHDD